MPPQPQQQAAQSKKRATKRKLKENSDEDFQDRPKFWEKNQELFNAALSNNGVTFAMRRLKG